MKRKDTGSYASLRFVLLRNRFAFRALNQPVQIAIPALTIEQAPAKIIVSGHSHFPVYEGNCDHTVGVVCQ
jgi:hypothetical protein